MQILGLVLLYLKWFIWDFRRIIAYRYHLTPTICKAQKRLSHFQIHHCIRFALVVSELLKLFNSIAFVSSLHVRFCSFHTRWICFASILITYHSSVANELNWELCYLNTDICVYFLYKLEHAFVVSFCCWAEDFITKISKIF